MFQRVLLDFVLKTFGLGAENETRARAARGQARDRVLWVALSSLEVKQKKPTTRAGFFVLSGKRDSNSRP